MLTTIITLDVAHPATRALIADGHMAHRLTMSGFAHLLDRYDFFTGIAGGHPDHRRAFNVLYATSGRPNGTLIIRLQSGVAPDFSHKACQYWRDAIHPDHPPVTRQWSVPASGTIRYLLRANAAITRNGRRHALNHKDDQMQWWRTRARAAGLELHNDTLAIDEPITIEFASRAPNQRDPNKRPWILPTQRFSGAAIVADSGAYRRALVQGIGRGLSYGAGLLLTTRG
jgi:hypothetical protein